MKAVLDTNVVVSGLISPDGPCAHILRMALREELRLCADGRILTEYATVALRPTLPLNPMRVRLTLATIRGVAETVLPVPLGVELPDPSDLPFLEVAAAANAVLVTGNLRHFPARARAGVIVVSPREFLDLLAAKRD